MKFTKLKDLESIPAESKARLALIQRKMGFVPNLLAVFGHSTAMLEGFLALEAAFEKSTLTPNEQEIVLLAASVENSCPYCSAVHMVALRRLGVDKKLIRAILGKLPIQDPRIEALVRFTRELVSQRGFVPEAAKRQFVDAGFNEITAMEVLMGVALKTMSNYFDHLNPIAIDPAFQKDFKDTTVHKEDRYE